jgi:hypothetical protein
MELTRQVRPVTRYACSTATSSISPRLLHVYAIDSDHYHYHATLRPLLLSTLFFYLTSLTCPHIVVVTMYASTPSGNDLSRSRLKQLATWIRDELDILVAREGPDILKPDDVLTLHETFLVLRQAQHITMADLRATGIHKAVQDIAGVATRWPSRLCDDCDNIISIWTPKFGPFRDIHPFLYGRGGRLEGIASVAEYTREVSRCQCSAG